MSGLVQHCIRLPLLIGLLLFLSSSWSYASQARDDLHQLVQTMGYGGAIHSFKNFVLRGAHRESYGEDASAQFKQALELSRRLQQSSELNRKEKDAAAALTLVIENYLDGLKRIKDYIEKGWRVEDIDRVVVVDDGPGLEGLELLRQRWDWSPFEEVEYQMGYVGAIHHFKNYVLRSSDNYYTFALEKFLAIESLMAEILSRDDLSEQQRTDLAAIERVTHGYMEYLALVERLIRMHRPIQQVDLAVKVNDAPALAALHRMRLNPVTKR